MTLVLGLTLASSASAVPILVTDTGFGIGVVETDTGVVSNLQTMAIANVSGISFTPDGTLYGMRSQDLFTIDPDTGASSLIGLPNSFAGARFGLVTTSNTTFLTTSSSELYDIDISSGTPLESRRFELRRAIPPFTTIVPSAGGLEFGESGRLFMTIANSGRDGLGEIDLNGVDGGVTASQLSAGVGFQIDNVKALAFADSTLYGFRHRALPNSARESEVFEIDVATGLRIPETAQILSGLTFGRSIAGATVFPPPVDVPEVLVYQGGTGLFDDPSRWAPQVIPGNGDAMIWEAAATDFINGDHLTYQEPPGSPATRIYELAAPVCSSSIRKEHSRLGGYALAALTAEADRWRTAAPTSWAKAAAIRPCCSSRQ